MTRTAIGRIGVRGGKYCHVLTWPAQIRVKLVARVHPLFRQASRNGVIRDPIDHSERVARAVAAREARSGIGNQLPTLIVEMRAGLFVAAAPPAHADHKVE